MPVVSAWCWFGVVAGSGVEMVGAGVEVVGACVMGMYPGVAAGGAGGREAASAPKWRASGGISWSNSGGHGAAVGLFVCA